MIDIEKRVEQLKKEARETIDGFKRRPEDNEQLNILCRRVLNSEDGEKLMAYILSISVNAILPTTATDAELRMQEGMRRLASILDIRRKSTPTDK